MSGGFAFVWDPDRSLYRRMNREMVDLDPLDDEDVDWLRGIVTLHLERPARAVAERILSKWWRNVGSFTQDLPEGLQARARSPTRRDRTRRRRRRSDHGGQLVGETNGFMKYERELPKRRPIPVRVLDWKEVYEDFPPDKVRTQGARCMDCGIPFCHTGCPLGNLIPEWNDLVYRDHWQRGERAAARDQQLPRVHRPAVPGAVRGRVRARHQRAAGHDQADRGRDRRPRVGRRLARRRVVPRRQTGKRVAVVGSGPAGLAAAQQLTRAGHDVTVYERADRIGGLLRYGIPEFKMEKRHLDRRIAQMEAEGTEFRTERERRRERAGRRGARGCDAVVLAGGATAWRDLPVPGPRARRHLPGDGVPAVVEPGAGGRPRRAADHRARASTS